MEKKTTLSTALVTANLDNAPLLGDSMGYEMVSVTVGKGRHMFTIHKNLICATGSNLGKMFSTRKVDDPIHFPSETPGVFILFVEYLYKNTVPCVSATSSVTAQAVRLRDLCQLYVFGEQVEMDIEIRNKVMDSIQDGFRSINRFPDANLVQCIYGRTKPGCILRKFCALSLLAKVRAPDYINDYHITTWLESNVDGFHDFFEALMKFNPHQDPRVRDLEGKTGIWPCAFHIHPSEAKVKREVGIDNKGVDIDKMPNAGDQAGSSAKISELCHLFTESI
ncbi:uncharacterized protein BP5553_06274 [Venustampulla echinocandica]|uniref:BTB domain-containing protein n=1 Tax=Venustampulla echinocandica TaxID=2656787 RepID=A0A370TN24_9HELO|nr:uncharacterized protein BP5553_06274 [Venustampulla echinocandica]RDL36922.1 hypothetical protein BP5553_06274 [Venustampulla echinocandica]